ncbi:hypothetical protein H6P81_013123 [Aristolochia fimbriata]|uniref:Uncharacterized protein n=1 Tax=Aristolochia fimbriata TaxID=158543 RepID=A0AAV7EFZ0_ARIFI|nr:hypothetical protein H6P81_013123 [Aristolochia fimbriata]
MAKLPMPSCRSQIILSQGQFRLNYAESELASMGDVSARMDRLETEIYALQASTTAIQRVQTLIALRCFHLTAQEQEELEVLLQSPPIEESHVSSSLRVKPYSSIAEDPPSPSPPPLSDLQHFPPLPLPIPPLRHSCPSYAVSHLDAMDDPFEAHLIDLPLSDHSLPLIHPVASRPALQMDSPTPDAVSTSPQQSVHRQPFDGSFRPHRPGFHPSAPCASCLMRDSPESPPLLLQLFPVVLSWTDERPLSHFDVGSHAIFSGSFSTTIFMLLLPPVHGLPHIQCPPGDVQPCQTDCHPHVSSDIRITNTNLLPYDCDKPWLIAWFIVFAFSCEP